MKPGFEMFFCIHACVCVCVCLSVYECVFPVSNIFLIGVLGVHLFIPPDCCTVSLTIVLYSLFFPSRSEVEDSKEPYAWMAP